MFNPLNLRNIVQIAYYVNDVEAAARKAHTHFGTGPFYIYKNIELVDVTYRGQKATLDHTSAYAQAGPIMLEYTQQNNDGPSAFTDMYPDGQEGIHHVAIFVDNMVAAMRHLNAKDCATVTHYFTRAGNVEVAFVDTRSILGHMVELYQPVAVLTGFYDTVARAAQTWDGKELFRYIG